jgi:micrococcal nuclease
LSVVRFDPRRKRQRPPRRDVVTPLLALMALLAASALGWVVLDPFAPGPGSSPDVTSASAETDGRRQSFSMCGRDRYNCVVDGDTIWLDGRNLRLASFDTPEPHDGICGGHAEVKLAKQASRRLLELLNTNPFIVDTFGLDNTGERTLATIRIAGRDVGDTMIEEGLARRWPDGVEWWCS